MCVRFLAFLAALVLSCNMGKAQIPIVPQERLDSIARPPMAANASALCFDQTEIDAGVMQSTDSPKSFEFGFINKSSKSLLIRKMVTTCSCAQAQCDKEVVGPGERAKINLHYTPKGQIGGFVRRVFVYTDAYDQPSAILKLKVRVASNE